MPKQIPGIREFLEITRRQDTKYVKIKRKSTETKFKVRCSDNLYILVVEDPGKADKLAQSLPPEVEKKKIEGDDPDSDESEGDQS